MMFGLGTGTDAAGNATNPPAAALPGFTDGLSLWKTPGTAVTAITAALQSPSAAFSSQVAPFTIGLLAVPLAIVAVVMSMGNGSGGGHHR